MSTTLPPTAAQRGDDSARETAVLRAYSEGAARRVEALCCPTDYDPALLAPIPDEVIERDYGCGNPARHLRPGDSVLDLGSGTGKICFIASQVVGPRGRVLGVDFNDDMLAVARRAAPVVAERIGHSNVTFLRGRIEDLALDLGALDERLARHPVTSAAEVVDLERAIAEQRTSRPMVADDSVDVVVSNCVLNLVQPQAKPRLFAELFRVLRRGGRAVISDIVADEQVPERLQRDPELWSGCVSGALREDAFLAAFEQVGFHGVEILERGEQPWQVVEGIQFRSMTVCAWKGKQGACLEQNQAVVYKGPWKRVEDDDGHVFERGQRMAVCGKTFGLMMKEPYAGQLIGIEPLTPVAEDEAAAFACTGTRIRDPAETKGAAYDETTAADGDCCEPGSCC
jgi:SAM-dependent methyltransferase